jgi:predicted acylesterase/phospholipase RssA
MLNPWLLFNELSYMIASCIMLDAVRHRNLGTAEKMFPVYLMHFDETLDDFCNLVWPCEYVNAKGRCVNVRAGHRKGHQMKGGQIVVAEGEYEASFDADTYRARFRNDIYNNLAELLQLLRPMETDTGRPEIEVALSIHKHKVLQHFYKHLGGAQHFTSHSACLSCLVGPAQHCLPCGHILCMACVQGYGKSRGHASMIIDIDRCPLHEQDGPFEPSWPIPLRPANAGVRILSLDGGGIRGIVELAVLQKIEESLGNGLRIQTFFDLIVGTSTGGIIALGLGEKLWSVTECTKKFEALARTAFTRQKGFGIDWMDFIIAAANHGRYKTGPLEETLQKEFGESQLFGGLRDAPNTKIVSWGRPYVAVLTTTTNGRPYVLANYNRTKDDDSGPYEFLRAERPDRELKIWEAARATSAALRLFKPYNHIQTGNVFMDGGIYYNNPVEVAVRESQLLWPDCKTSHPDLVLSVGTTFADRERKKSSTLPPHETGIVGYFKQLVKTAVDHVKSSLDSEQRWRTFINSHSRNDENVVRSRFKRVNFETAESPPRPDEVCKMQQLRNVVDAMLAPRMDEINDIADRLIATSFFFQPSTGLRRESCENLTSVSGTIVCRFPPQSYEIQKLGELFLARCIRQQNRRRHGEAHPCFVIEEKWKEKEAVQVIITDEIIDTMVRHGRFNMRQIPIRISNPVSATLEFSSIVFSDGSILQNTETDVYLRFGGESVTATNNSISGFPRSWGQPHLPPIRPCLGLSRSRTPIRNPPHPKWSNPSFGQSADLKSYAEESFPGLAVQPSAIAIPSGLQPLPDVAELPTPTTLRSEAHSPFSPASYSIPLELPAGDNYLHPRPLFYAGEPNPRMNQWLEDQSTPNKGPYIGMYEMADTSLKSEKSEKSELPRYS